MALYFTLFSNKLNISQQSIKIDNRLEEQKGKNIEPDEGNWELAEKGTRELGCGIQFQFQFEAAFLCAKPNFPYTKYIVLFSVSFI